MASRSQIRVAHLVENLEVGGLEKLLVEFARHADRSRFALRFLTLGHRGALAGDIEAEGWPVESLNLKSGLRPRAIPLLTRWFRRERIDVLHVHTSGPLLYGTAAAKLAGVPTIISTRHHGPDINNSPRAIKACALAANQIDRVVCVSADGVAHSIAEGVRPSKLTTILNGIDLDRFDHCGPNPSGPAVIVARLNPEKDHATLFHAVDLVRRVDKTFQLMIAGDGPCLEELESLAVALNLGTAVRFLGKVDDVAGLLREASMLVLSSVKEGISLTLLEAMARGLPVVATRVGGNPEVVVDGETGLLVPPSNPRALADALLKIRQDSALGLALGRAGRERAEVCFDIRRMIADYENLYANPTSSERALKPEVAAL